MSRSESLLDDTILVNDFQIERLALCYNKPMEYVRKAVEFFGVKRLPKFRTPYDGLNEFFSALTAHYDETPSMTKQEFAAECDLNNIMDRFVRSGGDPTVLSINNKTARYGDFTGMPDSYHAALNYISDTRNEFMKLDAKLRARFGNDPQEFLNYVSDPANAEEMVELGIAIAPAPANGERSDLGASEAVTTAGTGGASKKPVSKASKGGSEEE